MPEPIITPSSSQQAAAAPQGQPAAGSEGFKMPEKFAGKSAEEIAKAYTELESQHGKAASELGKFKGYEDVVKLGSAKDISDAIAWARQVNQAFKEGRITAAQAKQAKQDGPPVDTGNGSQAPWDNEQFDYLSPREQAKAIAEYNKRSSFDSTKEYIDGIAKQYGDQLQNWNGMNQRQQNILLKAIKQAIKNPDVDPEELLTQAAELAGKGPEELLNMAMEARMAPKSMEAEVNKRVAAKLAEEEQNRINREAGMLSNSGRRPTFQKTNRSRDDENREILSKLKEQGINLR